MGGTPNGLARGVITSIFVIENGDPGTGPEVIDGGIYWLFKPDSSITRNAASRAAAIATTISAEISPPVRQYRTATMAANDATHCMVGISDTAPAILAVRTTSGNF